MDPALDFSAKPYYLLVSLNLKLELDKSIVRDTPTGDPPSHWNESDRIVNKRSLRPQTYDG